MTQEGNSNPHEPQPRKAKDPLTNHHYLLPLPRDKLAPNKKLSIRTENYELVQFLEFYERLCAHHEIVSPKEKCLGLIGYCSYKIAKMIERLPSFIQGDYNQLVTDLHYFLEGEEHTYDRIKVEHFTREWRRKPVESLDNFKRYHRKFLGLVGQALGNNIVDQKECNRYFWEGIHRSLRKRIEERLRTLNPNLDITVPFGMQDVVNAVKTIFDPHRFDLHLFSHRERGPDMGPSDLDLGPKYELSDSEDDESTDSDSSEGLRRVPGKKRMSPSTSFAPFPRPGPRNFKKPE